MSLGADAGIVDSAEQQDSGTGDAFDEPRLATVPARADGG